MLPKLFYSICYTFWILTTKCFVSCKIQPKTYEKYLTEVMDHISEQDGWNLMQNLKIKYNHSTEIRFNIKNVICKESRTILTKKFDAIIHILNYMYTKVIKTFIDHIRAIANQCQEYYDLNQGDNLLSCTVLLQSSVENSKTMFEQLYNVMNYFGNIDFKLLANTKKCFTIPIVDEIYTFVEFAILKSQQNTQIFIDTNDSNTKKNACEVILDVNSFIEGKGHEIYQKIKETNSLVIDNHKPKCLLEENLKDYKEQQYKNIELSHYLSEWLNMYYGEISTKFYKNLGFEKILDLNEESSFKPPVHFYENISQSEKIEQLNTITNENGWKSLKNINIVFNDQVISVERILRHPADKLNFHCKKQHILRLIKCIYTEILFKYCKYVKFILNFCDKVRLKCDYIIFIHFVRQIFDAVIKTTEMFDIMYKTLVTSNELLGEYIYENANSNIKCFCSLISKLLEEINSRRYPLDSLDSKSDIWDLRKNLYNAKKYVQSFSDFLKSIKFRNALYLSHEKQCPLRNLTLNIDIPGSLNPDNFSSACDELILFSKNFIKLYYEELGLSKLN
ncbi:uncharacterized protein LOC126909080 [Daktulosphaira vitifoliae]|uniref:uncharacterized protein LOC126909080 n=1 Tax=Daktulosphaira vitifoliae TaxID=58002 RepID=UPI0021AAFE1F|nr:uncharacterized protein LOC126909080 [Daktulosphaira vitifoliae]